MELAVESAEGLLAGDSGSVAAENFDWDDERVLHEVVVNHAVTYDGRPVVRAGGEQGVSRVETHLRLKRENWCFLIDLFIVCDVLFV